MSGLVVVTALRSEYAALTKQVPGAVLERCGMGPERVREWLPRLRELDPTIVARYLPGQVTTTSAMRRPAKSANQVR